MAEGLGFASEEALLEALIPQEIRTASPLNLPEAAGEAEALGELKSLMERNRPLKSFIGQGYYETHTPGVIRRNIFENPGWYTQYTPYQAEISQGRLEALLNFQTMTADLTGLDLANASLLDEATAAAEAMHVAFAQRRSPDALVFAVAPGLHPQTVAVLRTRAEPLGVRLVLLEDHDAALPAGVFGGIAQYPCTDGLLRDPSGFVAALKSAGALAVLAVDPLALTLLKTPGEFGADIAVGSAQRFGIPLGYGGPHPAFFACRDGLKRLMPGRLVGLSKDRHGAPALRLALQTREQHIRREKATSNICTAQVLLAVMAGMYAVYHGPEGLRRIAARVRALACELARRLREAGLRVAEGEIFDTARIDAAPAQCDEWMERAVRAGCNLRRLSEGSVCVAFDEMKSPADVALLEGVFLGAASRGGAAGNGLVPEAPELPAKWLRGLPLLPQKVFNSIRSETEMLRYIRRLEAKDLSLCHSMIPLGSCTMKLNASTEMFPLGWDEVARLHPFCPADQAEGYAAMASQLCGWLGEITGLPAVSLQPNAGSQGEYAGLLAIRRYHAARGEASRDVCLIPVSAHGTNPASAVMAGLKVVPVACEANGDVDLADLEAKARQHAERLAAVMVTYPSTHGVFEGGIRRLCEIVHAHGGQVYLDGANFNALVGLCRPGEFGADVCHLNLHKTFCIPHGGGGPGVGPVAAAAHLAPYLPGHPLDERGGAVSAAPLGSASILVISWLYIRMMGARGLREATATAILSANHIAARLAPHYPIVFKGRSGLVAHECIIDLRPFKVSAGIEVDDVAKRLMDYGFHAPTMSWPVAGTMMIEPTESESLAELDRFCEAMIRIREEIAEIERGVMPRDRNPLKNAPHTAAALVSEGWSEPYTRERGGYPALWTRQAKFWPPVGRVDNVFGDRNLVCSCPSVEELAAATF